VSMTLLTTTRIARTSAILDLYPSLSRRRIRNTVYPSPVQMSFHICKKKVFRVLTVVSKRQKHHRCCVPVPSGKS
jgi:hypothetical protein